MVRIKQILGHIKEDALEIQEFVRDITEADFVVNKMARKAVCMSLLNIGELVKTLPEEFKQGNPEIPWRKIAGFQDLAAHQYHRLDFGGVWVIAQERIPELIQFIDTYKDIE